MKTGTLFVEATGITDARALRQVHIADFLDVLAELPPTYRKSPAEREMSLRQIAAAAAAAAAARGAKAGLSAATVNRTLTELNQIVAFAKDRGPEMDGNLQLVRLKRKSKIADKDKRRSFSDADVKSIFAPSVWQGSASIPRPMEPGPEIIRDALYWLHLIATYTGARREEIAGLMREDLQKF